MSAYGAVISRNRPAAPLASTAWLCKPRASVPTHLTLHHLTLASASMLPGLVPYLHRCFADELERGATYPQEILPGEPYTQAQFETYYFAADVIVGIVGLGDAPDSDGAAVQGGVEEARQGRGWEECVAGVYYVKPNYPGRSSHICNAGFLIPLAQRAKGFGSVLAKSYLHYAPRLGYEASVFNLVYVNNIASVRMWESLGFTKAGLIPRAGRLKKADGSGEEYVDAWVIYKQFETVQQ
ncbi:uncharacterized protein PHACADRAFT_259773 [Phanerochaete carnosa HHB-10118-sp]|uniref:N-acetyltransferase domain-containing protein n=1 Tax=Phanerochaete carnosa (strain HHB-10118-sp) TaxID=650164 RepID=K5W2R6_PHACS|nr:uncharacterized protein PHACADRAFT_259773 [Phanerochaete carnosa HHB-10118-sp]EKM53410.1 hypothetical protein PHACADRAFT_259773 [Phanerochaete carnosa HHB-10118-sp]